MVVRKVSKMERAARQHARRGWRVIPLVPGEKKPMISKWPERAAADLEQICKWWKKWPDANIGIVCGFDSDLVVIDVDNNSEKSGDESLRQLEKELGKLPQTLIARSPNGRHYYFVYPDSPIPTRAGKAANGIDTRAEGGYIVAPGSMVGGKPYDWLNNLEPASVPKIWVEYLQVDHSVVSHVIEEGYRNSAVYSECCLFRRAGIPYAEARSKILEFNLNKCHPSLNEKEVLATLDSAYKSSIEYQTNERGNALRFVAISSGNVRYVIGMKSFIVFDGAHWLLDREDLMCLQLMKSANDTIWREIRNTNEEAIKKELFKHAISSQNTRRLKFALESVKSEPDIAIEIDELDSDSMLLGVENGVVNLKTGKFRRGSREDYITKIGGCEYVRGAKCPRWLSFLNDITAGDKQLQNYLQRLVGYSLTGSVEEQILLFTHGSGGNGKTVFIETIKALLGDYASNLRTEALMERQGRRGGASPDEARLRSARFVTANETQEGMKFDSALIKDLVGDDTIAARHLYKGIFEFKPQFKLWIRGNYKPSFRGTDEGMLRRLRLIPFLAKFTGSTRDKKLQERLKIELPGILNWAIRGCLKWQRSGLSEPRVVRIATEEYKIEMDPIGRFLRECCSTGNDGFTTFDSLLKAYQRWCTDEGVASIPKEPFGVELTKRNFKSTTRKVNGKNARGRVGLKLNKAVLVKSSR